MAGTINTQAQLQVSSSATYTTNAANLITAGLVRTFNENWISSSVVIPMTASMTVLSSSYAYTASSAISSSFATTASFALSAPSTSAFPFTGSAAITGSLTITGSIRQFVENTGSKTTTITAVTNSFVGNTQITGSGNGNNAFRVSGSGNFAGSLTVSKNLVLGNQSAVNTSAISVDSTTRSSATIVTLGTTATSSFTLIASDTLGATGSSLQIDSTLQNLKFYDYDNTSSDPSVFLTINSYDTATKSIPTFNRGLNVTGSLIVTGSAVTQLIPITVASNTASIDCIRGNLFSFTLGAASTTHIAFSNIKEGQTGNLLITTAATSTASFSSNVKQISGSQYTATSGSGQTDLLSFATVGSSVYVVNSKKFV